MSKIFQSLELQAFRAGITPRTKESREWFRKKANNLRRINRESLMKEEPLKQTSQEAGGTPGVKKFQRKLQMNFKEDFFWETL